MPRPASLSFDLLQTFLLQARPVCFVILVNHRGVGGFVNVTVDVPHDDPYWANPAPFEFSGPAGPFKATIQIRLLAL
jgi:hypothetical protein